MSDDNKLREITRRSVEYRAVESIKQPNLNRGVLAVTGTWVAPLMNACLFIS